MKATELLAFLQEFYDERAALWLRHLAVAHHVGNLDFNNTYQYVVSREDTHIAWLRSAIEDLGGVAAPPGSEPVIAGSKSKDFAGQLMREDARGTAAFLEKWKDSCRGGRQCPCSRHAARDAGRDAGAPPLLRAGSRRT